MLEDLTPPQPKTYCITRTILEGLAESDAKILTAAIQDTAAWSAKALSRELGKRGIQISDVSIQRHRIRSCSCSRI